jgi:hypothetical protein
MSPGLELGALSLLAMALIASAIYIIQRVRGTPESRERKRRLMIHRTGRLGDAEITEVADNTLFYSYFVRGVQYATSQDVATLQSQLPPNLELLIGPAALKYSVNNPANSILVCEEWNGCRKVTDSKVARPLLDANAVRHEPEDPALT